MAMYLIALIIAGTWWPSHQLFKLLRKRHRSIGTLALSILGLIVSSILLVAIGYDIGQHIHDPAIRSLYSTSAGTYDTSNLFWFPFAIAALGLWAGLLSGYFKMQIDDEQ